MPVVTPALALIIFAAGTVAGSLGALLGLGGGVFLVPFLNLVVGFPFGVAAAISLTTVIATSSTVSAGRTGKQLINMRLGMLLKWRLPAALSRRRHRAVHLADGAAAHVRHRRRAGRAHVTTRLRRRNVILDPAAEPGLLGEPVSRGGRVAGRSPTA
jgi:hypothetical protein